MYGANLSSIYGRRISSCRSFSRAQIAMNNWIALNPNDTPDTLKSCIGKNVKGIQSSWDWNKLEPRPADYDFSGPLAEKAICDQAGIDYCLRPIDKTFGQVGAIAYNPMPAYLQPYSSVHSGFGYVLNRWDGYAMDRYIALLNAAYKSVNLVATQETSLGCDPVHTPDYCVQIRRLISLKFPDLRFYQNYLDGGPSQDASLSHALLEMINSESELCAPDILPDDAAFTTRVVPRYQLFKGYLPLTACMQDVEEKAGQFDRYYAYARDVMGVDTVVWNRGYGPDMLAKVLAFIGSAT